MHACICTCMCLYFDAGYSNVRMPGERRCANVNLKRFLEIGISQLMYLFEIFRWLNFHTNTRIHGYLFMQTILLLLNKFVETLMQHTIEIEHHGDHTNADQLSALSITTTPIPIFLADTHLTRNLQTLAPTPMPPLHLFQSIMNNIAPVHIQH